MTLLVAVGVAVESQQQIITVKEARKLLGKKSETMSEDQVKELIDLLTSMAEDFLQNNGS